MRPVTRRDFSMFAAAVTYCVALVAALLVQLILGSFLPDKQTLAIVYSFLAPTVYVATVFILGRVLGVHVPLAAGIVRAPKPRSTLWVPLLAIACILAFLPLAVGLKELFGLMGYNFQDPYFDYRTSWGNMILGLVGMALMPALGEECLLRGCVFSALKNKGTYFGIFMTALLFGLMHGSPVQFIHQFLIGAVMCYLVYMSGSIWPSVIFHFCNNAIVIIYEFAYVQTGATYRIPWWGYLLLCLVFVPIVGVLLITYGRFCRKEKQEEFDRDPVLVMGASTPDYDASTASSAPFATKARKFLDYDGKFLPYNTTERFAPMLVAFLVTAVLWLANTITGWLQK